MRDGIVEVVVKGALSADDSDKIRFEILKLLKDRDVRGVIVDVRASTGQQIISDAYYRVRSLAPGVKRFPCAVVDLPGSQEFKSFFETTAANACFTIKWFSDIESARTWLISKISNG